MRLTPNPGQDMRDKIRRLYAQLDGQVYAQLTPTLNVTIFWHMTRADMMMGGDSYQQLVKPQLFQLLRKLAEP